MLKKKKLYINSYMAHFDTGYFKNSSGRSSLAKKRKIENKIISWSLGKEYYDGKSLCKIEKCIQEKAS